MSIVLAIRARRLRRLRATMYVSLAGAGLLGLIGLAVLRKEPRALLIGDDGSMEYSKLLPITTESPFIRSTALFYAEQILTWDNSLRDGVSDSNKFATFSTDSGESEIRSYRNKLGSACESANTSQRVSLAEDVAPVLIRKNKTGWKVVVAYRAVQSGEHFGKVLEFNDLILVTMTLYPNYEERIDGPKGNIFTKLFGLASAGSNRGSKYPLLVHSLQIISENTNK